MALSNEQLFILNVLTDHLHNSKTRFPDNLNISILLELAKAQESEGILYAQTALPECRKAFSACSYYGLHRRNLLKAIHARFKKENIIYLIFKGTEIADFYPFPLLRTMGDSDILVHPEDKERAHSIFLEMGMKNHCLGPNDWIYYVNDMEIELHHKLMYDEIVSLPAHQAFMAEVWTHGFSDDGIQYHLDPTWHFAFLLLHLRKHLMNSGVGFRQFMDLAVMVQKSDIDWTELENLINKLEIAPFSARAFALMQRWFKIEIPIFNTEITEAFFEAATLQIFNNGVFGFHDENNLKNSSINQIREESLNTGSQKMLWRFYFPNYRTLSQYPKYAFLKGRPWLLPAAWFYRVWYALKKGSVREKLSMAEKSLNVSNEDIKSRETTLKNWGLIDTQK